VHVGFRRAHFEVSNPILKRRRPIWGAIMSKDVARASKGGSWGFGAFLVGMTLAGTILGVLSLPAFEGTDLRRYLLSHDVEKITLAMFCWGLADLLFKGLAFGRERRALRRAWLPESAGRQPVADAHGLLAHLETAPRSLQRTWLGERLHAGVEFVRKRGSSAGLDEHLRYLGELAAERSHAGYALVRVIAWMIPILGFLGTVVGITIAVANVSPNQLDSSLTEVTGGLAMAFDATAVALALAMMLMFAYFLVERVEGKLLHEVERASNDLLLHRFERIDAEAPLLVPLRRACDAVVAHSQTLLERQIALWNEAFRAGAVETDRLLASAQASATALVADVRKETARERAALTSTAAALSQVDERLAENAARLAALVDAGHALAPLQQALAENLVALRQTQGLDEAMHGLTAAIHLLTARSRPLGVERAA
jgi:biopolymer transport protein ExbB/TolQ